MSLSFNSTTQTSNEVTLKEENNFKEHVKSKHEKDKKFKEPQYHIIFDFSITPIKRKKK